MTTKEKDVKPLLLGRDGGFIDIWGNRNKGNSNNKKRIDITPLDVLTIASSMLNCSYTAATEGGPASTAAAAPASAAAATKAAKVNNRTPCNIVCARHQDRLRYEPAPKSTQGR